MAKAPLSLCPRADRRKWTANRDAWKVEVEVPDLLSSIPVRAIIWCLFQFLEKTRCLCCVIAQSFWSDAKVNSSELRGPRV